VLRVNGVGSDVPLGALTALSRWEASLRGKHIVLRFNGVGGGVPLGAPLERRWVDGAEQGCTALQAANHVLAHLKG